MILSMLAVLLLFALINGLLVYSMIDKADEESVAEFDNMLRQDEKNSIDSWLSIARSIAHPYITLSRRYSEPDSTESYKNRVLDLLKDIRWSSNKNYDGYYFVFDAKTGNAIIFRDSLGHFIPTSQNVLEIPDENGKFFAKEILEKTLAGDTSVVTFKYSKPCLNCEPIERMAKGIYIEEWNWIVATGSYSEKIEVVSKFFTEKFHESRVKLIGNLFGIMLISFLIGMFMVFRQMNSFIVPLRNLSNYLHRLASEGIRFEDFEMHESSQTELKILAEDLNSLVHNVGSLIENVHINADRVSDLSGACSDMLDIVDYDAKLVGQRTAEMAVSSEYVINNMKGMAEGIKEINTNLDDLKKLTSHITENTMDIKSYISQVSSSIKELKEKSYNVQHNSISVTQAVNDIGLASSKELNHINEISNLAASLREELHNAAMLTSDLRKGVTIGVAMKDICNLTEDLYNKIVLAQTHLTNMQDSQVAPLVQTVEERRNLSKEISADTLELNKSLESVVNHIAEINSSSEYINSSIKFVSDDINEAYNNLEEIVNATNSMNEHAKQASGRMDEFFLKAKRVEEAHSAIEHTLIDAKDSMKSLNDLSANLRKVVDDLVRLDNKAHNMEVHGNNLVF
jgi:methyl-accepting chemotaxis protein